MAKNAVAAALPAATEIVTREILRVQGLNAQAFSGSTNPSTIYRYMVDGMAQVFPYYRELEEKDSCIASSLEVRRLLVMAREWSVVGADEQDGQAVQYQDEASAFLRAIPNFDFVLEEMLNAPAYGFAVAEIMWTNNGGQVEVEKIIGRPQEFFDFRLDYIDPPLGDLRFCPDMIPGGQEVPQNKFLVSTYKPRHGDRRGLPLLRRLFWPSWFKRQGLRLDLQFLEKGQGTVAVQYPSSGGDADKANALQVAEAIVSEVAVAMPQGMQVLESLLSGTRQREGKDYQTMMDYLDSEMTRLVLGQTLTTRGSENQRGTQALGNVHQDLLYEIVKRDANQLSAVIDEQLLAPWLGWTFGDAALDRAYRPHFCIDVEAEKDLLERARALKEARNLVDIPLSYAREELGIPAPEKNEPLVNAAIVPIELTGLPPDEPSDNPFGKRKSEMPPDEEDETE